MYCGIDVGSTTNKFVLCADDGTILSKAYERHESRQAEKVLETLTRLEQTQHLTPGRDRILLTGSGAGLIAPRVGGRLFQEVVAVAAAVERLHPSVRFVSEIGGEDMKTIFFTGSSESRTKQVFMQAACSGGTGTFIEKTARKLGVIDQLPEMKYSGLSLHKLSSKCGIFAEADSNTLVKAGVPVNEIIASLFEAAVYQNLSTLTKGNTPLPEVLLLGGPNLFFTGLQEAWRAHLKALWRERQVELPPERDVDSLIRIPDDALFYAALGCVEISRNEAGGLGIYQGIERLQWWVSTGQHEQKMKEGRKGLCESPIAVEEFQRKYKFPSTPAPAAKLQITASSFGIPAFIGCDFGSTTAKAVCLTAEHEIVHKTYVPSQGNPIDDAKRIFREIHSAGIGDVLGLGITGYGADVLKSILGADVSVVETVAHATSALHFFPDADCICDVGGMDIKIMMIKNGKVSDFRLNSQCSSGNGAFLQGVAERFNVPLTEIAERAFRAKAVPKLTMGCGVFLQSDIVNQQRKGWSADEILGGLCAIVPLNVWIYAGGLTNLATVGRKFILQGGTHLNVAVVKAQADFIQSKLPDAEIVVHPYSGEAGAIGAALCASEIWRNGKPAGFRGFHVIDALTYNATTSTETVCTWCPVDCHRTFVDVEIPGGKGRPWSRVPLAQGWERIITNNSCPKGLVEDVTELRITKAEMERVTRAYPNIAEMVRKEAFSSRSF